MKIIDAHKAREGYKKMANSFQAPFYSVHNIPKVCWLTEAVEVKIRSGGLALGFSVHLFSSTCTDMTFMEGSAEEKPNKILHQKFTKAHLDRSDAFLEQVLQTDEAPTDLFGLEKERCVWRTKATKLGIRSTCPTIKNGEDPSCRGES